MPEPNENVNSNESNNNDMGNTGGDGNGNDTKWYQELPETMHEHVQGFESQEKAFEDFIATKDKLPIVPEDESGYKYEYKEEDEKKKEAFENWLGVMRKEAKSLGLTQKQFEGAVKRQMEIGAQQRKAAQERATKALEEATNTLKKEWGDDYDKNAGMVDAMATELFDDDFKAFGKNSGLFNNPAFIKGMFELSKKFSEDTFTKGGDHKEPKTNKRYDPHTGLPMIDFSKVDKQGATD